jgi:Ser-tRNA(Ala) deacylase AlaX
VQVAVYDYEAAKKEIEIPPYIPQGKRFRYLRLHKADKGIPCGGTHVKHLQDIGRLVVTKLTKKGKNVRLSYRVEDK